MFTEGFGEFVEFAALFGVELGGHGDLDVDIEIAVAVFAQDFHAFAAQAEGGAVLGAGGHFDGSLGLHGGDGELATEGGGGKGKRDVAVEVVAFAFEDLVGSDLDDDVEIAGRAVFHAEISVAGGAQTGAVFDACRHFDADFGAFLGATSAVAVAAGVADHFAAAAAIRAGLLNLEEAA